MDNQIYQIPKKVNYEVRVSDIPTQNGLMPTDTQGGQLNEVGLTTETPAPTPIIPSEEDKPEDEPPKKPTPKPKKKIDKVKLLIIGGIILILLVGGYLGATNPNLRKQKLCNDNGLLYDTRGFCYSKEGSETLELHEIQYINGEYIISGK